MFASDYIREDVRSQRLRLAKGFELYYAAPPEKVFEYFSREEIESLNSSLVLITGQYCVGKTAIVRRLVAEGVLKQMPETVCGRDPRIHEVIGEEILPVSRQEFEDSVNNEKMLLAYADNGGNRKTKLCGFTLETIRAAARTQGLKVAIVHALVIPWLISLFDCQVILITADAKSHRKFQRSRGLSASDCKGQSLTGAMAEYAVIPGAYTNNVIWNVHGQFDAVVEAVREAIIAEYFIKTGFLP